MGRFFVFKQKTAYELRISDWSSDVCSSDLCKADPFSDSNFTGDSSLVAKIQTVSIAEFEINDNAAAQPQYVIENMGSWPDPSSNTGYTQSANSAQYGAAGVTATAIFYRITARSGDPADIGDRAVVTLQAMYKQ